MPPQDDYTEWPARVPSDYELQARRASVRIKVDELEPYVRRSPRPTSNREEFLAMLRRTQSGGRSPVRRNPCGNINHPGYMDWEIANPLAGRIREAEDEDARRAAAKREPVPYDPNDWTG